MRRIKSYFRPEIIGNPACPVMHRWTLAHVFDFKLIVHHFMPDTEDPHPHDHPRSFVTLILKGGYIDESAEDGVLTYENMTRGMVRFRRAQHLHRTLVGSRGCWSVIVMGPVRQRWGFMVDEVGWVPFGEYIERWGREFFRCPK